MHIIDISLPLETGMAVYPGDPPFRSDRVARIVPHDPDTWNTSRLELCTHTGTHVDAPRHFDDDAPGAEALPLELLCGPVRVADLRGVGMRIEAASLETLDLNNVERLLLRTDSESLVDRPFDPDYAHVTEEAARMLRQRGVRLVGIDSPSIEAFDSPGMPVHHVLLKQRPSMVVVEGLDLRNAAAGDYSLFCLPLKLVESDGAPARAVLVR
jgi:arylformamidase